MSQENSYLFINRFIKAILIFPVTVAVISITPLFKAYSATPPCPARSNICAGLGSRPDDRADYCDNNLNGNQDPGEPDIPFSGCCAPFYPGDDQYCRGDGGGPPGPPSPPEPPKLLCEVTKNVDCGADGTQCGKVSGQVFKVLVNQEGRQTSNEDAPVPNVGIAWIEGAFTKVGDDQSDTYKYTQTDENGRFSMEGLDPNKNAVLGVFCGKRLIETVGVEWGKTGRDVKFPASTFVYSEDLNCTENDFCYRLTPKEAINKCSPVQDEPQFKVYYPWGDPPSFSKAASFLEACGTALGVCIQQALSWTEPCFAKPVGESVTFEMNRLSTDWFSPYQANISMFGPEPSSELPSCDELQDIKRTSSGINLPRGGMTAIASARPSGSNQNPDTWGRAWRMCWNAYTTPGESSMDRPVCSLTGRTDPVKLREIQFPLAREMDGDDILSKEFFPYWLCGTGQNDGGFSEARGAPMVTNTTDQYSCDSPNKEGGCTYNSGAPNTLVNVALTGDGEKGERMTSLRTANKSNDVLPYGRPGKQLNERAPQRGDVENSGISRARIYGEECTCPEDRTADYQGQLDASSVCKKGGIKYNITTCLNNVVDRIIACNTADPPPGTNCDIEESSTNTFDIHLPYVQSISNVFANMSSNLNRPGQMVAESACLGTVTGTTDETRERIAYSSGGCSSVIDAKNSMMLNFRRPRDRGK